MLFAALCAVSGFVAGPTLPPVADSTGPEARPALAPHPSSPALSPWVVAPVLGIRPAASPVGAEGQQRPKAIEYSDGYHVRLKIHQIGSYLELPLFAGELIVGQKLAHDRDQGLRSSEGLRGAHGAMAAGLGVLFTVNTVTGLWNLWESRKDPAGRTRRVIHSVGMLLADAGFLATAGAAPDDDEGESGRGYGSGAVGRHRNLAIASVSVATLSTAMMWLWKD